MHNLKFLSLVMKAFGTLMTWKSGLNIPLWFWGFEDLWILSSFHLIVSNESSQGGGERGIMLILGRGIHGQQPLVYPMLFYSRFQCCKLRWWKKSVRIWYQYMACAKKGIQMYYRWKDAMKPKWGQIFWEWFIIIMYKRNRYMYMYRYI